MTHHHTYTGVDGIDYQILLEADYLVNADESHYPGKRDRPVSKKCVPDSIRPGPAQFRVLRRAQRDALRQKNSGLIWASAGPAH